jgi:CHRD domain
MQLHRLALGPLIAMGLAVAGTSVASAQGYQFFAVLNGGNVASASGQAYAGVRDGSGAAALTATRDNTRLCVTIVVNLIDKPTVVHLHEAPAGKNGPIVATLAAPAAGNPGTSGVCLANPGKAMVQRLRDTPSNFYIDVHTGDFPGGSLRGQIH